MALCRKERRKERQGIKSRALRRPFLGDQMENLIGIIGIGAVMMIAPIAIGITLIYSYEATKNIGNEITEE